MNQGFGGGGGVLRERAKPGQSCVAENEQAAELNIYSREKSIHLQMADTVVDRKNFMQ
jgi:hypothetical protein